MTIDPKKRFICLIAAMVVAGVSCVNEIHEEGDSTPSSVKTKVTNTPDNSSEDRVLICLSQDAVEQIENSTATVYDLIQTDFDKTITPMLGAKPQNEKVARKYGLHRWYVVTVDGISTKDASQKLSALDAVSSIEYEKKIRHGSDCISSEWKPSRVQFNDTADLPFNDPMLVDQWNYINRGEARIAQTAREGGDIGVKDAWKLTGGDPRIIVAVLDGPVKYNHPDIAANMWVNSDEIAGNGIDDDKNGYIDDIHGYNFERKGALNWDDPNESGHGTHVAGIVGAVNGNGIGVCGVAGGTGNNDGVKIMSCQIFQGGKASMTSTSTADAFIYAADNGASIAQCSFGYEGVYYTSDREYAKVYPAEYAAIQYFMDPENNNSDILDRNIVIFASGNDGHNCSSYPGALESCISVTALGPDELPVFYTNYGAGCNIAAPGGDTYVGTIDVNYDTMSYDLTNNKSRILSIGLNDDYIYMQGTSMACPHVSGVAALGLAYAYKVGKKFTADEYISMILTSTNELDSRLTAGTKPADFNKNETINLNTYEKKMGTGAIDAWKLLMAIEGTPCITAKIGESQRLDLTSYFGESASKLTYLGVDIDAESRAALGLTADPEMKYGKLSIHPTKIGSGKVTIRAIAGGDVLGGDMQIGGSEISREVSIISRNVKSSNGGWL